MLHSGIWFFSEKLIRALFNLIFAVLIARHLGPIDYGKIVFVITYISFFQALVNLGIDGIVVRDIAGFSISNAEDKHKSSKEILGNAFTLRTYVSVVSWVLSICFMQIVVDNELTLLTAIIGAILLLQPLDTIDLWFQSQHKVSFVAKFKIASYFLTAIFRIYLIYSNKSLLWFAFGVFFEYLFISVAIIFAFKRSDCILSFSSNIINSFGLLRESWVYLIYGLLLMVSTKVDQVIINYLLEDKQYVGLYVAGVAIVGGLNMIGSVASAVMLPNVSKLKVTSEVLYRKRLTLIFRTYILLSFVAFIGISFFSSQIISLLYGVSFLKSGAVLAIYSATLIPASIIYGQMLWINNERQPRVFLFQGLLSASLTIIFNFLLIPIYGLPGAAFASVISLFLAVIIVSTLINREFSLIQLGFYRPPLSK